MSKTVRLSFAALALAALTSFAVDSAAEAHGRGHAHAPSRRAKVDAPAARAARSGSAAPTAAKKAEPAALPAKKGSASALAAAAKLEKADSVGSPNEGRLEGGIHLDLERPYFRVVPAYGSGDVRWGLPALINLLDRAARAVHKRYPGAVLDVGDVSRKGGGDVLRHHSHESGRDADVGFYAVDAKGKQVHAHAFVRFEGGMESSNVPGAYFDVGRNWLFVQEMLMDPRARVSHIFIAAPLRERLLAHAKTHGVSRAILDRAAIAMMQPTTSLPHDDHFHVRISCPASMRGSCVELAKNALPSKRRVAARVRGTGVLRTPGKGNVAQAKVATGAPHATAKSAVGRTPPRHGRAPAISSSASQDAFVIEPGGDEAESDAADVRDAVDESGAIRITD